MAKYQPLADHLMSLPASELTVTLTFAQVSNLVGELPPTAYRLRQWWANDSKPQARAWRSGGWRVDERGIDFNAGTVRFAREYRQREDRRVQRERSRSAAPPRAQPARRSTRQPQRQSKSVGGNSVAGPTGFSALPRSGRRAPVFDPHPERRCPACDRPETGCICG